MFRPVLRVGDTGRFVSVSISLEERVRRKIMKRIMGFCAVVLLLCGAIFAQGSAEKNELVASYPSTKVSFIIPYSAGGGTDSLMRVLTTAMEKKWGQSVIVSNKGGGLGQVGLTELSQAKADGYTIGALSNLDHILVLLTGENVSYAYDSFEYLGAINTTANVLMSNDKTKFKSLDDMIVYAKANPGKLTVAISGKTHIAEVGLLEKAAGIKVTCVMQTSGGESLKAILGGHTDLAVMDKKFVSQVAGQGVTTLATFAGDRIGVIKDIPTMKELGFDVATETYRVVVAPKGTPKAACDAITATMKEVSGTDEFKATMEKMGEVYRFLDQKQVKQKLDGEYEAMKKLVADNPTMFN